MKVRIFTLAALAAVSTDVAAREPQPMPEPFQKLVECRAITAPDQRLACYDQQVQALDAAEKKKDIVVVSKQQVREARRSLFGFTLPNLSLFGGGAPNSKEEKADEITRLETKLVGFSQSRQGNWHLQLAEGGTWETLTDLDFDLRPGDKVVINKAALGSFLGQVGNNRGVRMRRVN